MLVMEAEKQDLNHKCADTAAGFMQGIGTTFPVSKGRFYEL